MAILSSNFISCSIWLLSNLQPIQFHIVVDVDCDIDVYYAWYRYILEIYILSNLKLDF